MRRKQKKIEYSKSFSADLDGSLNSDQLVAWRSMTPLAAQAAGA
jgi:hypothetical protein